MLVSTALGPLERLADGGGERTPLICLCVTLNRKAHFCVCSCLPFAFSVLSDVLQASSLRGSNS
jgi:hypothetical protein